MTAWSRPISLGRVLENEAGRLDQEVSTRFREFDFSSGQSHGLVRHFVALFWLTGSLSAFLDNAPSYQVF
jgi:hypothetical protein